MLESNQGFGYNLLEFMEKKDFIPDQEVRDDRIESQTKPPIFRDRLAELLRSVKQSLGKQSGSLPDLDSGVSDQTPYYEQIVDQLAETLDTKTTTGAGSILQRIRKLPAAVKGTLAALVLTAEAAAAQLVYQTGQTSRPRSAEAQSKDSQDEEGVELHFGQDYVMVEDDATGIFLKHNIDRPESLAEVGKMFLEPLSFGVKFRVGRDSEWTTRLLTGSKNEPFVFSADIPYEYARDFDNATPTDRLKMEEDMQRKAHDLLEKILPSVIGLSFHKDEVRNIGSQTKATVSELKIDGFASPESDAGVGTKDPRNQQLSELRAENATNVLQKLFKDRGIEVEEIKYKGQGEIPLSEEERSVLLKEAFDLKIGANGMPEDGRLLELVKQYNAGNINSQETRQQLDQIIGGKRKVAITISTNERTYVLVFPLPILALAALRILSRINPSDRGSTNAVYAEFVPGPPSNNGPLGRPTRREARHAGRNLRRGHFDPVQPARDVVKGYSSDTGAAEEYRDRLVQGARHWRKRTARERVQLGFDPNLSLPDRTEALAFVVDRYLRMTPTLMGEQSLFGRRNARDYDLSNIYQDREALQSLLTRIARTDVDLRGQLNNLPPPVIPANGIVRFEFRSVGPSPQGGGTPHRREAVYVGYVTVNNIQYHLNRPELSAMANHYIGTHRVNGVEQVNDIG